MSRRLDVVTLGGDEYDALLDTISDLRKQLAEAYEQAAKLCDTEWNGDADTYEYANACNDCAAAIRAAAHTTHDASGV